jgi:hypothetical protein
MVSEVTRREIIDWLSSSGYSWSGRLQEDEFLSRLYDLDKLPSNDSRFSSAAGDIWQHRSRNTDWSDDWVFYDDRFRILRAPDEMFLRFLCEVVHPVVRTKAEAVKELVEVFNRALARDGWELYEVKQLSGRPIFGARQIGTRVEVFEEPTGWAKVDRQIAEVRYRLREASNEEHFQAIGLICREVLITLGQQVFRHDIHISLDGVKPSNTDAKRMLDAFIATEVNGHSNDDIRGHAKAALKLALALQHDRMADFRTAALCAEATASVVNIVAILAGRRDTIRSSHAEDFRQ